MSASLNLMSSLHWVQGELAQSLNRVRMQIEQYMETPANSLPSRTQNPQRAPSTTGQSSPAPAQGEVK